MIACRAQMLHLVLVDQRSALVLLSSEWTRELRNAAICCNATPHRGKSLLRGGKVIDQRDQRIINECLQERILMCVKKSC